MLLLPKHTQILLDQVLSKMTPPSYEPFMLKRVTGVVEDLVKYDLAGIEPFLRKLMERSGNKDEFFDFFREGRFASILAKSGFTDIKLEPFEAPIKGPDIEANYKGELVYFEITRRREAEDEWKLAEPGVVDWIDPDRVENIISRILNKTPQLLKGKSNVVVLWSDTIGLGTAEMAESFEYIAQEIEFDPNKYTELSAVLFTTGGYSFPYTKQFYLHVNTHAVNKLSAILTERLETMTERDPLEIKQEMDALAEAFRRLHSKDKHLASLHDGCDGG